MTRRDVVDVHDIKSGVEICRHPAGGGVQHHPAPSALVSHLQVRPADHVGKRDRGFLAPGRSIGRDTDGGDAARIDDAADAGDARRSQDTARPFDIGSIQLLGLASSQAVVCRNVKQRFATGNGLLERARIVKIADDRRYLETLQAIVRSVPSARAVTIYRPTRYACISGTPNVDS